MSDPENNNEGYGSKEYVAFLLAERISPIVRDEDAFLDLYSKCLEATRGKRKKPTTKETL